MTPTEKNILILTDRFDTIKLYQIIYKLTDYHLTFAHELATAEEQLAEGAFQVVLFDCMVVNNQIIRFFETIQDMHRGVQKILVCDHVDHHQISELISRGGLFNYLLKPVDPKRLSMVLEKALEQSGLIQHNETLLRDVQKRNAELKQLLAELEMEEEKFRVIFNSSPDAQFIITQQGVVLDSNPIAVRLCGQYDCMFKEQHVTDVVHPQDYVVFTDYLKRIPNCQGERIEVKIRSNAERVSSEYEVTLYPIKYKGTEAYMISFRDISERKGLQKKVMQTIIQTEEKERRRFAQELHDGIGPLLSTTKLYLQWFNKPQAKMDKAVIISKMEETLEETILSLREISNNISPKILVSFGLEAALRNFIGRLKNISGIEFEFDCQLSERPNAQNEITVYRLVCELIHNSIKHSQTNLIRIFINSNDKLTIRYEDEGVGFNVEQVMARQQGSGLVNIINRVEGLGGKLTIRSAEGNGIQVHVLLEN
jgi:PAS domain S-box-containing protein